MSAGVLICWRTDGTLKRVNIPSEAERWASMYDSAETQAHRLMAERDTLLALAHEMLEVLADVPQTASARLMHRKIRRVLAGGKA